jgi:histidinol dehydrogenase
MSGGFCRSSRRPAARRSCSSPSSGCSPEMNGVAAILEDVRLRGDVAVREWARRLDGVEPARAEAAEGLPKEAVLALVDSVRRWHEAQRPADVRLEVRPGVELERRWVPLATVGVYVPHGLVSTLVMCAVPALAAGVRRIIVATPPRRLRPRRCRSAAPRHRGGLGTRRAARDRRPRVRNRRHPACRQDLRPRWQVRERGEAARVARRCDRPARRPSEVVVLADQARTPASRTSSSPHRQSTAPIPSAAS